MNTLRLTTGSKTSGFSLIEVLIAVVVLSVGLLALAALQGQLIRGSTSAKSQTQATALAQETLEQMRGFKTTIGSSDSYQAIVPPTTTASATAPCSGLAWTTCTVGANTYTRTIVVNRYLYDNGTKAFVSVTNNTTTVPVGKIEFKDVTVDVSWTNEAGTTTDVQLGDVISVSGPGNEIGALTPPAANTLHPQVYISKSHFAPGVIPIALGNNQSAAASDPQPETFSTGHITTRFSVLNYTDSTSDLVLLNKQFDFAATSCTCNMGGTSTASASTSPGLAYAPTYWNGTKYVAPTTVVGKTIGTDPVTAGNANNSSQDPILCQACCRDHHDGSAQTDVNGNPLLFDAFRPTAEYSGGDHKHYDLDSSSNLLTMAATGSGAEYFETCRFVRVNGINAVATDARLENHLVIAPFSTSPSSGQISVTIPSNLTCDPSGDNLTSGICFDHQVDTTTAGVYASFVKDYVAGSKNTSGITGFYDSWVSTTAAGTYPIINGSGGAVSAAIGNLLGSITVALTDGSESGTASTLAAKSAYAGLLNPPTTQTSGMVTGDLQTTPALATSAQLYLEGRGIYIDYISPEAKNAINCVGQTSNVNCTAYANLSVLQVMPFVAVNLTNLDSWVDNDNSGALGTNSNALALSNDPIPTGGTYDPDVIGYKFDRGSLYVVDQTPCSSGSGTSQPPCSTPKPNIPDYAWARARRGNAGLIDSLSVSPSYPYEAYYCITWNGSGSTAPEPTGVCPTDPPSGTNVSYATVANTTTSSGASSTAADGVNFRSDTQPYTSSGATAYDLFKTYTTDKTTYSGSTKSNLGNPIAISITRPTLPRTISTCKLGKGGKQPFHCYDSNVTTAYSPITLNFANYNTQVSCNGQNCPNPPTVNTFNLCKLSVPSGVTGNTSFTVTNSTKLNEQTSVTLTLPSLTSQSQIDTYLLNTLSITACFATSATTCSTISCP